MLNYGLFLSAQAMTKKFNYTEDYINAGGYNKPQPGMTPVPGSSSRYYGHDGFIYDMLDGSRVYGDPPAGKFDDPNDGSLDA